MIFFAFVVLAVTLYYLITVSVVTTRTVIREVPKAILAAENDSARRFDPAKYKPLQWRD